jgi:hypothetical protein
MARARNIKPAFYKNEHLAGKSPHARLLYIGLWCLADCKGRLEDRPMRIKAELFPYEAVDIEALLAELSFGPERFIVRYEIAGNHYIEIPSFSKHQNPHKNEKEAGSRIPSFSEEIGICTVLAPEQYPSSTVQERNLHPSSTELAPDLHSTAPADSLLLIPDSLTLKPECVSDCDENENLKFAQQGLDYLISLDSPNHCNAGWVRGYLSIQLQELKQTRPDLSKPYLLGLWRDTCDQAIAKNAWAPQWFKTTFEKKVSGFVPTDNKKLDHGAASGQARDNLMKFPYVRHILTGEVFPSIELEVRPESPETLYFKGNSFPVGMLESLGEMPE